ncbi:MAG: hypothetical protein AAGA77_23190 [Bacteroidota bacterium]
MTNKNFNLTIVEFDQMVSKLKQGDDDLFEHVFLSHFEENKRYLIRYCKIEEEVAYDVCLDTMLEFMHKLKSDKIQYGNLKFLFNQMSKNKFLQMSRIKERRMTAILELEYIGSFDASEKERLLQVLDKAWQKLGSECQKILKMYYYEKSAIKDIAAAIKKSEVALRKQKQRCLFHMKNSMTQIIRMTN